MKNKEILVPTSLGELLDKISILKIKKKKIVDKTKKKKCDIRVTIFVKNL